MLLPQFDRIYREDLGANAPSWVDKIISPINNFMQQCWIALNNNLTIGQNITGLFVTLQIQTPSDYAAGGFPTTTFSWPYAKSVDGVFIASLREVTTANSYVVQTNAISVDWQQLTSNQVTINYIAGLAASKVYNVKFMAL